MFLNLICFIVYIMFILLGGYGAGVPPLPIPNREVKPGSADGTAFVVEYVAAIFQKTCKIYFLRVFFFV